MGWIYAAILKYLGDGNIHKRRDIIDHATKMLNLDDDCLSEKSSKRLFVYDIRGGWGLSYLKQSGLIESHYFSPIRSC
jgi:restriction endonuclease Mrr